MNANDLRKIREAAFYKVGGKEKMIEHLEGLMVEVANNYRSFLVLDVDYVLYTKGFIRLSSGHTSRLDDIKSHFIDAGFSFIECVIEPSKYDSYYAVHITISWEDNIEQG